MTGASSGRISTSRCAAPARHDAARASAAPAVLFARGAPLTIRVVLQVLPLRNWAEGKFEPEIMQAIDDLGYKEVRRTGVGGGRDVLL